MLVLTRQKNQTIKLGDDVSITIVDIDGDRVRIGIDAPKNLRIMRAEILEEVRQTNKEAVQSNTSFLRHMAQKGNQSSGENETDS